MRDVERVKRWEEEEVETEYSDNRGNERGPAAPEQSYEENQKEVSKRNRRRVYQLAKRYEQRGDYSDTQ